MLNGFQAMIILTGTVIVFVSWFVTKFILRLFRLDKDRQGKPPSPAKDFAIIVFTMLTFVIVTTAISFAACGSMIMRHHPS